MAEFAPVGAWVQLSIHYSHQRLIHPLALWVSSQEGISKIPSEFHIQARTDPMSKPFDFNLDADVLRISNHSNIYFVQVTPRSKLSRNLRQSPGVETSR